MVWAIECQGAPGKGEGACDQAEEDYYEVEVSMEELLAMLFSELELPNLHYAP
ncbi:MAG: sporulation protein YhbH [Paenibacillus sp.]|jgi:uncharacterized sporulation protein YeaH/YhbH (DUF444 family)|nr:sporulation protein YhbH [Paenibacillus sp.]